MGKILIIEDDNQLQIIYKKKLTLEGFNVLQSTTGQEGLLSAKSEKPDIILLDVMLPGGQNGFDILEQIKRDETLKNTPVLILTNLDTEEQTAMQIGAADYIVKANTSLDEMVVKVKKYIKTS